MGQRNIIQVNPSHFCWTLKQPSADHWISKGFKVENRPSQLNIGTVVHSFYKCRVSTAGLWETFNLPEIIPQSEAWHLLWYPQKWNLTQLWYKHTHSKPTHAVSCSVFQPHTHTQSHSLFMHFMLLSAPLKQKNLSVEYFQPSNGCRLWFPLIRGGVKWEAVPSSEDTLTINLPWASGHTLGDPLILNKVLTNHKLGERKFWAKKRKKKPTELFQFLFRGENICR